MDSIIMIRIPNGSIAPVTGDDGEMIVYPSLDDAIADAEKVPIIKAGCLYQCIELDEL